MKFTHYDLGWQQAGTTVEVTLAGNAANVRLLDTPNLNSYRAGRNHHYVGGAVTRSPIRLEVPHSGHWHIAVDLSGLNGNVRSSVRVLPG